MKIQFVINGLGTGGAERSTAELLPGLASAGIDATVACLLPRQEGVQSALLDAGADVRFLDGGGIAAWTRSLRRLLRDEPADLVHTTVFEADIVGRVAGWRRAPVLTSLVNTSYEPVRREDPNIAARRLEAVRLVDGWTARRLTAHFHAITHAVKASAVEHLRVDPDRVTVIYRGRDVRRLGVPSAARRQAARGPLGLAADDEVVVAVGRQEWQKGHVHLLAAVPALVATRPRAVVLIAGRTGNSSRDLERAHGELRRAGFGDRVRFLGHRDDLPEVLAAADVFAFPSRYEGLGGSVLEAMAMGVPVVASDLPAIREVVDADEGTGNALLVPAADPEALAGALASVLADPARAARMAARGREKFATAFTVEQSTAQMIDLYRRLTGR